MNLWLIHLNSVPHSLGSLFCSPRKGARLPCPSAPQQQARLHIRFPGPEIHRELTFICPFQTLTLKKEFIHHGCKSQNRKHTRVHNLDHLIDGEDGLSWRMETAEGEFLGVPTGKPPRAERSSQGRARLLGLLLFF